MWLGDVMSHRVREWMLIYGSSHSIVIVSLRIMDSFITEKSRRSRLCMQVARQPNKVRQRSPPKICNVWWYLQHFSYIFMWPCLFKTNCDLLVSMTLRMSTDLWPYIRLILRNVRGLQRRHSAIVNGSSCLRHCIKCLIVNYNTADGNE